MLHPFGRALTVNIKHIYGKNRLALFLYFVNKMAFSIAFTWCSQLYVLLLHYQLMFLIEFTFAFQSRSILPSPYNSLLGFEIAFSIWCNRVKGMYAKTHEEYPKPSMEKSTRKPTEKQSDKWMLEMDGLSICLI